MKNSFLEKYLHDLNKELSILPNKEKMHYMEEMKDHLFSLIEEKKAMGMPEQDAIKHALKEFPKPKVLVQDYLKNNKDRIIPDPTDGVDFKFRFKAALIVIGLAELTLLLADESLNVYLGLIGIIMILVGNVLIVKHENWNADNLKQLIWTDIAIWVCLPLALILFFRRSDIDYFLTGYLLFIILLIVMEHIIVYKTFKLKNYKV